MKKIGLVILTLILTLSLFPFSASAAGKGTFSLTNAKARPGDIVTVDVNLSSNPGLITMRFEICWDGNLELMSVSDVGLLKGWSTPSPSINSPYTLRWSDALATTNNTSKGKVATLKFKVKDSATAGDKKITLTFLESRDANGNKNTFSNTTATVTVSRAPSAITSSKYKISGKNISKIAAGTTASTLLSGLNERTYCKVYKGNTVVSGNTAVGTGMVVKIMDGNTVKASYTIIVTGDTNGDGNTTITDMIAIKAHVLKKSTLSGVYATAADTNGDKGISITDFIQIKAKILGKGTITAR